MKRHLPNFLLPACLILAFLVYFPGTSGYFLFDDTLNIVDNAGIKIQSLDFPTLRRAALSGDAGMLGRPLSMLSFALNFYVNGLSPYRLSPNGHSTAWQRQQMPRLSWQSRFRQKST